MTAALRNRSLLLLLAAIAAAWMTLVGAQLAGLAPALHHHALASGGRPLWQGLAIFAPAWLLMVVAMMLPSSLAMLAAHDRVTAAEPRRDLARLVFLVAYLTAWTLFGLLALVDDTQVHAAVRSSLWLADNQYLIGAATLVGAGLFQFTPLKRRCLTICRSPLGFLLERYRPGVLNAGRLGLGHALYCIGCCWALMFVTFAAGVAALTWMLAMSAVMVVEKTTPRGDRLAIPVGVTLILGGVLLALGQSPL